MFIYHSCTHASMCFPKKMLFTCVSLVDSRWVPSWPWRLFYHQRHREGNWGCYCLFIFLWDIGDLLVCIYSNLYVWLMVVESLSFSNYLLILDFEYNAQQLKSSRLSWYKSSSLRIGSFLIPTKRESKCLAWFLVFYASLKYLFVWWTVLSIMNW